MWVCYRVAFMLWSMIMLPFGLVKAVANFDRNCLHGPSLSGRKVSPPHSVVVMVVVTATALAATLMVLFR